MARSTHDDYAQMQMLPISLDRQLLPGTCESTLAYLIDEQIDLSVFEARDKTDEGGAPAYDPAILRKSMLCADAKGILDSRRIEPRCREHVGCMARSADTVPPFTTIAHCVSSRSVEITLIFRNILLLCDEAGRIGQEMCAIDGMKRPANASQEWSGTKADLTQKARKMRRAVEHRLSKHQASEAAEGDAPLQTAAERQMKPLKAAIEKVEHVLATHGDKIGTSGKPKQRNITDHDRAKLPTGKGVIQGDDGLALADSTHQVVVHADAFGAGQEHGLLVPRLQGVRETCNERNLSEDILPEAQRTADAGYSSEDHAEDLFETESDAYVADNLLRKRDPRLQAAERHQPTRADDPFGQATEGPEVPADGRSAGARPCTRELPGGQAAVQVRPAPRLAWISDVAGPRHTQPRRLMSMARARLASPRTPCRATRGIYRRARAGQAWEVHVEDEAQARQ